MTGANSQETGAAGPFAHRRRNLAAILLGGAAGAGLVLLATRPQLARVVIHAPRPLPDTVTTVTAYNVRPAIAALAIAALASLAAVIATRGLLRRMTGLITVVLGAGVAVSAMAGVSAAAVLAAARHANSSPAGGGAGTAAGSVTAGNGGSTATGSIAGFPMHVVLGGTGWRLMMLAGALLIVAAGIAVIVLARRLPVMSGRYDRQRAASAPMRPQQTVRPRPATAGMWESLSAGSDPTATGPD
jgi:uncharacterized membrane protein (TIGR02234 family)